MSNTGVGFAQPTHALIPPQPGAVPVSDPVDPMLACVYIRAARVEEIAKHFREKCGLGESEALHAAQRTEREERRARRSERGYLKDVQMTDEQVGEWCDALSESEDVAAELMTRAIREHGTGALGAILDKQDANRKHAQQRDQTMAELTYYLERRHV